MAAATIDLRDKKSLDADVEAARQKLAAEREEQRKLDAQHAKERNAAYGELLSQVSWGD